MSKCQVFLVYIFLHADRIWRNGEYPSVFSPNVGKYRQEKLQKLQTLFMQCIKLKKKKKSLTKKINTTCLIMVLVKMRLLIFLVLSGCGLACKYEIILQISIYNWMQNCIVLYFWYCILIFSRSNYNS